MFSLMDASMQVLLYCVWLGLFLLLIAPISSKSLWIAKYLLAWLASMVISKPNARNLLTLVVFEGCWPPSKKPYAHWARLGDKAFSRLLQSVWAYSWMLAYALNSLETSEGKDWRRDYWVSAQFLLFVVWIWAWDSVVSRLRWPEWP